MVKNIMRTRSGLPLWMGGGRAGVLRRAWPGAHGNRRAAASLLICRSCPSTTEVNRQFQRRDRLDQKMEFLDTILLVRGGRLDRGSVGLQRGTGRLRDCRKRDTDSDRDRDMRPISRLPISSPIYVRLRRRQRLSQQLRIAGNCSKESDRRRLGCSEAEWGPWPNVGRSGKSCGAGWNGTRRSDRSTWLVSAWMMQRIASGGPW